MKRAGVLALALFPALMGCGSPLRLVRPSDFPFHATRDRFFDLHWRLDRSDGAIRAVGLVEAARVDGIAEVILELRGLDSAGHTVSRGLGRAYGGRLLRWEARPFAVSLRPTGRETRFELTVWSFSWEGTRNHPVRHDDSRPPGVAGARARLGRATAA